MREEITYVIGHKNPDTDSIVSAIALAELKNKEGAKNVIPARAGDVNSQTQFILEYFNIESPKFLGDVFSRANDLMSKDFSSVQKDTPLLHIIELIKKKQMRFIPVLDNKKPIGTISLFEIAKSNMVDKKSSRKIFTSLDNIAKTLDAKILHNGLDKKDGEYTLFAGAMSKESFEKTLKRENSKKCVVVVGDRQDIQDSAITNRVSLLIISGGFKIEKKIIEKAKKNDVSIIISQYDSATTSHFVKMSTPAYNMCETDIDAVSPNELLENIKRKLTNTKKRGLVVVEDENIKGVITKNDLLRSSSTKLILVDHNELSQSVDGTKEENVIEVVDHHRLGNFHTTHPIHFKCEPVGSTSTLVAEMYREQGISIKKDIAGLLLGGVLSDTIILKSPTTTKRDKEIVAWLEKKSNLNHKSFGREIFAASSSIKKRGAKNVVNSDYKIFSTNEKLFGIGQVETIGFEELYFLKEKLKEELFLLKEKKGLKLSCLLVTDIVAEDSLLLTMGDQDVIASVDYPKVEEGIYELKGVLSRKMQLAPHLLNLLN